MTRSERRRFDHEDRLAEAMEHDLGSSLLVPDLLEARPAPAMHEPRSKPGGNAVVYSDAARRRIVELRRAGESFRAIARAIGGSRSGVRQYWVEHGSLQ